MSKQKISKRQLALHKQDNTLNKHTEMSNNLDIKANTTLRIMTPKTNTKSTIKSTQQCGSNDYTTLREKCVHSESFISMFQRIRTDY